MKQYRVKALSYHSDATQKVYKAGDIIPADVLHEGEGDKGLASGFLEEYHGKKNEHSGSAGTPHVVTALDAERYPNADFKEGDTIYLPYEGFVLDDSSNQATNEEGLANHDSGKVLVTADQAKAPITPPASEVKPEDLKTDAPAVGKIILPGGEKVVPVAQPAKPAAQPAKKK
jgi:hypothetical protein